MSSTTATAAPIKVSDNKANKTTLKSSRQIGQIPLYVIKGLSLIIEKPHEQRCFNALHVSFDVKHNMLVLVANSGKAMLLVRRPAIEGCKDFEPFLLPYEACPPALELGQDPKCELGLYIGRSRKHKTRHVFLRGANRNVSCPELLEPYPDFWKFIPLYSNEDAGQFNPIILIQLYEALQWVVGEARLPEVRTYQNGTKPILMVHDECRVIGVMKCWRLRQNSSHWREAALREFGLLPSATLEFPNARTAQAR